MINYLVALLARKSIIIRKESRHGKYSQHGYNENCRRKIRTLRESLSISMEELAERSGLAVEQIERIENNVDIPS